MFESRENDCLIFGPCDPTQEVSMAAKAKHYNKYGKTTYA